MRVRSTILIVVLLSLIAVPAHAADRHVPGRQVRLALLIGNSNYALKVGPLKNPGNDIALVGAALKRLGFKVTAVENADYRAMDTLIKRYVDEVREAGDGAISFFYYSGHGVANPKTRINYLIPIDISDPSDANVWYQSVQQNDVIDKLSQQAPNATHYVVFDACRNELNLSGPASKALGAEKGFVPVQQTAGLLIAYATAPNKTASDVGEGGGPYAKALAEELVKPGIEAVTMFRNVQIRVKESIGQDPWLTFPSLPSVYLAGRPSSDDAAQAWAAVKDTNRAVELEAFIRRYGDSFYGDLARTRLEELKKSQVAIVAPPVAPTSPPATSAGPCGPVSVREKFLPSTPSLKDKFAPSTPSLQDTFVPRPLSMAEECALKPKDVFKECDKCPEMVVVPAGSFAMGSPASEANEAERTCKKQSGDGLLSSFCSKTGEGPLHNVSLSKPFAVGRFSITFDEWDGCVADGDCNNYRPNDQGWGRGRRPVINVSWDDAKTYVAWLSRKTGKTYRLLSESEREYVTRAGTTTPFWWGSSISTAQANYDGTFTYGGGPNGEYRQKTLPVDSFQPNPWGLYQMHGNVDEWVEDCWHDNYTGAPSDGSAWTSGGRRDRIIRGGGWNSPAWDLRAAVRYSSPSRSNSKGFRLARTLAP